MKHLMMTKPISLTLVFLMTAFSGTVSASPEISGRASVIDGDTMEIHGQRIRLHGIDAPEGGQMCTKNTQTYNCGQQAAFTLDALVSGRTLVCQEKDVDRYGRIVAECFAGATNLNAEMVKSGWALAYRQYSQDYVSLEQHAQSNKRGMWQGEFQNPWDYRRNPSQEEIKESNGCLIKGNINSEGRKIYHLPGTSTYGRTKINEDNGERWFCSESQASTAGWSPVKH